MFLLFFSFISCLLLRFYIPEKIIFTIPLYCRKYKDIFLISCAWWRWVKLSKKYARKYRLIHVCVLTLLWFQMDSHTLCPCLSAFLSISVSVRLCEQTLNSSESAIAKYAEQEDKKQNTWLCWRFDLLLYAIFLKKKVQISVWLKMLSPSTNNSSRVPLLSLFSEPSFRLNYGELDCKTWGCEVLSDNLKGPREGLLPG